MILFHGLGGLKERLGIKNETVYFDVRPIGVRGFNDNSMLLSGNTATYAAQFALAAGYSDIRLLGVDLCDYDRAESHCYGDGKKEGCKLGKLTTIMSVFKKVRDMAHEKGATIVNESPVEGPLDEVFPRRKCPWLIEK